MSEKLIQSYVVDLFFVSTIYRESSAPIPNLWYYETMAWEWDRETRKRGELLLQEDSGTPKKAALENHARVCARLATQEPTDEREA